MFKKINIFLICLSIFQIKTTNMVNQIPASANNFPGTSLTHVINYPILDLIVPWGTLAEVGNGEIVNFANGANIQDRNAVVVGAEVGPGNSTLDIPNPEFVVGAPVIEVNTYGEVTKVYKKETENTAIVNITNIENGNGIIVESSVKLPDSASFKVEHVINDVRNNKAELIPVVVSGNKILIPRERFAIPRVLGNLRGRISFSTQASFVGLMEPEDCGLMLFSFHSGDLSLVLSLGKKELTGFYTLLSSSKNPIKYMGEIISDYLKKNPSTDKEMMKENIMRFCDKLGKFYGEFLAKTPTGLLDSFLDKGFLNVKKFLARNKDGTSDAQALEVNHEEFAEKMKRCIKKGYAEGVKCHSWLRAFGRKE